MLNEQLRIPSKLPRVGTTIFTVMSKLAADVGALNLSQGFPNFPTDPVLLELVTKAMRDGHNQYAPMAGVPALRAAIARKTADCYGVRYDPETEITVTAGATEALYAAITAVVQLADEVLVLNPLTTATYPPSNWPGASPFS